MTALLGVLAPLVSELIARVLPEDPEKQRLAEAEIAKLLLEKSGEIEKAQASIITAEAQSEGFLTRSWRPIAMLTFLGLAVARFLGLSAPNVTDEEYLRMWDLLQLGIGGYIVGRSGEKIVPAVLKSMANAKR